MKIKYVWHDEPNKEIEYDSAHEYEKLKDDHYITTLPFTKEEFEKRLLTVFSGLKEDGRVLRYEIVG